MSSTQKYSRSVYIAVVGLTGSGKSTFTSQCSGQDARIGHGLRPETSVIEVFSFQRHGRTVHLIDTPGFDDPNIPDAALLEEIAFWLVEAHGNGILLNGIIYLQPITHNRIHGSSLKCLRLFRKICGPAVGRAVILGTSMWDKVDPYVGERRETELVETPEFWGDMIDSGNRTFRFRGDRESGLEACDYLIGLGSEIVPALQQQLVNEHKRLADTDAGQELQGPLLKFREDCKQELQEARNEMHRKLSNNNEKSLQEFSKLISVLESRIDDSEAALQTIKIDAPTLLENKRQLFSDELDLLKEEQERDRNLLAQSLHELERLRNSRSVMESELQSWRSSAHRRIETEHRNDEETRRESNNAVFEDHQKQIRVQEMKIAERGQRIKSYSNRIGAIAGILGAGLQAAALGVAIAGCTIM